MLQGAAEWCRVLQGDLGCRRVLQGDVGCCRVLQGAAKEKFTLLHALAGGLVEMSLFISKFNLLMETRRGMFGLRRRAHQPFTLPKVQDNYSITAAPSFRLNI